MTLLTDANKLAADGQVEKAFTILTAAAERGDADAACLLAEWRMAGVFIRRDIAEARRLFGISTDLGCKRAEAPYLALLANGAGNIGRDWRTALERLRSPDSAMAFAKKEVQLLEKMDIDEEGNPNRLPGTVELSTSPDIRQISAFLSVAECQYLTELSLPLLQPSVVVNPNTGALIQNPIRTSMGASFPFIAETPFLHAVNRRIAAATQTLYGQGEPMQILSYTANQQYKLHSDAITGSDNQRVTTVLVYLNDDFEGGETHFPAIENRIRGRQGDAIIFANVDPQGNPDQKAIHAGLPVKSGRKIVLSKWIRAKQLDLAGPPGRPF